MEDGITIGDEVVIKEHIRLVLAECHEEEKPELQACNNWKFYLLVMNK
jgi:hypothetical protein